MVALENVQHALSIITRQQPCLPVTVFLLLGQHAAQGPKRVIKPIAFKYMVKANRVVSTVVFGQAKQKFSVAVLAGVGGADDV